MNKSEQTNMVLTELIIYLLLCGKKQTKIDIFWEFPSEIPSYLTRKFPENSQFMELC